MARAFMFLILSLISICVDGSSPACERFHDQYCRTSTEGALNIHMCDANYGRFHTVEHSLQNYAMKHITTSFYYLLTAAHFGSYYENREGFQKLYNELSDDTWEDSIKLIKHINKRGGKIKSINPATSSVEVEVSEFKSLVTALDKHKALAEDAHEFIDSHSQENHRGDPEITSFLEENLLHKHSALIRELSGHVSDVRRFIENEDNLPLSLQLFDEYLLHRSD